MPCRKKTAGFAMALVHVNGHLYYTRSVRIGGRVTSQSYGPAESEYARFMTAADRLIREEGRAERIRRLTEKRERFEARQEARRVASQECPALRERLDTIDRLVAEDFHRVRQAVGAWLTALGYHRHDRGEWRRRRRPMRDPEIERYGGFAPLTAHEQLA
jgi:hypothetical protein